MWIAYNAFPQLLFCHVEEAQNKLFLCDPTRYIPTFLLDEIQLLLKILLVYSYTSSFFLVSCDKVYILYLQLFLDLKILYFINLQDDKYQFQFVQFCQNVKNPDFEFQSLFSKLICLFIFSAIPLIKIFGLVVTKSRIKSWLMPEGRPDQSSSFKLKLTLFLK